MDPNVISILLWQPQRASNGLSDNPPISATDISADGMVFLRVLKICVHLTKLKAILTSRVTKWTPRLKRPSSVKEFFLKLLHDEASGVLDVP